MKLQEFTAELDERIGDKSLRHKSTVERLGELQRHLQDLEERRDVLLVEDGDPDERITIREAVRKTRGDIAEADRTIELLDGQLDGLREQRADAERVWHRHEAYRLYQERQDHGANVQRAMSALKNGIERDREFGVEIHRHLTAAGIGKSTDWTNGGGVKGWVIRQLDAVLPQLGMPLIGPVRLAATPFKDMIPEVPAPPSIDDDEGEEEAA